MNVYQKPRQPLGQQKVAETAVKSQAEGEVGRGDVSYRRATYQDVLDAPPNMVAEIVGGRLHTHPRPAPPHARAGSRLGAHINLPYDRDQGGPGAPGGWWILNEPELHFGTAKDRDILVPDIAGWRRKRMPRRPDTAFFPIHPDWVCEVLSPSTRHLDLGGKQAIYAREGIPYMWLIDPDPRTLDAFELQDGQWVSIVSLTGDVSVSVPPFDSITFPLKELWWD